VFCASSAGAFIECLAGESCFAAAHPPAPVRPARVQCQAATNSHQNRQPERIPAKPALPASEKCAEPSLRSPRDVGWQVAKIIVAFGANVSLKKCHAVSITPGARTHQEKNFGGAYA
jgi:hypothetical protein